MRKIIHCDFDCFYAAIEIRDDPSLKGLPIAIGGHVDKRGVIATCSYEARAYGIHSAMASASALKKCPELIFIRPNMKKYKEASLLAHDIFKRYSSLIEPLSLDEAFLDVSENTQYKSSATLLAEALRNDIETEIGVTASAGIAPNKFLAKIASDWNKPNGQFTISPEDIDDFVHQLPIGKIFGIGKVTERKMRKRGVKTCGDLRAFNKLELVQNFGGFGERLYELCRGIDNRKVNPDRIRKSISVENTFVKDLANIDEGLEKLKSLEKELKKRCLKINDTYFCTGIYVKVKFSDFSQTTVEKTAEQYNSQLAQALLKAAFKRSNLGVRLIGLGLKLKPIQATSESQLNLNLNREA